jgi:hypothetical protein
MEIRDLSKTLNAQSMTVVRGGDSGNSAGNINDMMLYITLPASILPSGSSNTGTQVSGTQHSSIWNYQNNGDFFFAPPGVL